MSRAGEPGTPSVPAAAPAGRAGRVELTTVREVWLRVIVDGRERAADLFAAGRTMTFEGRTVVIRAGDAGAVRLTIAGRPAGTLGPDGAVLTRRLDLAAGSAR